MVLPSSSWKSYITSEYFFMRYVIMATIVRMLLLTLQHCKVVRKSLTVQFGTD